MYVGYTNSEIIKRPNLVIKPIAVIEGGLGDNMNITASAYLVKRNKVQWLASLEVDDLRPNDLATLTICSDERSGGRTVYLGCNGHSYTHSTSHVSDMQVDVPGSNSKTFTGELIRGVERVIYSEGTSTVDLSTATTLDMLAVKNSGTYLVIVACVR